MSWLFEPGRPWRAIDSALAAAVARRWPGIPDELLRLFAATAFAAGQGHGALDPGALIHADEFGLPDWPADRWLALLSDCPAVACGATDADVAVRPFVLDHGLLYLRRFHRDEVRLAEGLRDLSAWQPVAASPERIAAALAQLFPGGGDAVDDLQARACLLSLAARLTVVLGGPGTGKTTTVLRLLALHQMLAGQPLRLVVAAPTGKAAARVGEAMQAAAAHIGLDPALRAALPARALTLHRLLGAHADGVTFRHGRNDPIACDLVVLDEASMVDLALFARLVEALPDHARLVILGDPDQLEAIESGAVLAELARLADSAAERAAVVRARACLAGGGPAGSTDFLPVGACQVRLTQAWRFSSDSGIGRLSAAVRAGDVDTAWATLRGGHADLGCVETRGNPSMAQVQSFVADHYRLALASRQPATMLAAHRGFRVLAATRADVARANGAASAALGQRLREMWPEAGLPFLIERNDALRRLHNGDTGVFAYDQAGGDIRAWLGDDADAAGADGLRVLAPHELGRWQAAYAMTVHRAQGSEYGEVLLLLPARPGAVASRSWLYTAISRARDRLVVVGDLSVLAAAVSQAGERTGGLARRLRSTTQG